MNELFAFVAADSVFDFSMEGRSDSSTVVCELFAEFKCVTGVLEEMGEE